MSEVLVLAASTKLTLLDLAKQARALGDGLQNVAPSGKVGPNHSVEYLISTAEMLTEIANDCDKFAVPSSSANLQQPGV